MPQAMADGELEETHPTLLPALFLAPANHNMSEETRMQEKTVAAGKARSRDTTL